MQQPRRKQLIYVGIAIFVIIGGVVLFNYINSRINVAILQINTAGNANVFVRTPTNTDFVQVSTGPTTLRTKSFGVTHVSVRDGDQSTETSVDLQLDEYEEVNLELRETKDANPVSTLSLTDTYKEGGFLFGISPNTGSIGYIDTTGKNRLPESLYFSLPELKDVAWVNANNFIYRDKFGGVGVYRNGNEVDANVAFSLDDLIIDFAKAPNKPTVLLTTNALYTAPKNLKGGATKIANVTTSGTPSLDANENAIIYSNTEYETAEDEGDAPSATGSSLTVYGYDGQVRFEIDSTDSPDSYQQLLPLSGGSSLAVGSENVLKLGLNGEALATHPAPFEERRFLATGSEIYAASVTGVWTYNPDTNVYYRLYAPQDNEQVAGSVDIIGNELSFSTTPIENKRAAQDLSGYGTKFISIQ